LIVNRQSENQNRHLLMRATYHNHSTWSDGKASVTELIDAARAMGVEALGISDHWVLHPQGKQFKWAMQTDRLADYVGELRTLRDRTIAPALLIGLEVDWHPSNAQSLLDVLDMYPLDYILGSVHEVQLPWKHASAGEFMIDGSPAAWQTLAQDQINEIHRQYWRNIRTLAQSGVYDIVAHIDLPKKFGFYATADLSHEIGEALDAIAVAKTPAGQRLVVEINTAGWHKPCADAYPSLEILRECRRRDIPATMSADAHHPEHLLRDFDRAAERLQMAGYSQIARFEGRHTRLEPLSEAVRPRRAI
jgi:histidinol-phosphatase (PHP family)